MKRLLNLITAVMMVTIFMVPAGVWASGTSVSISGGESVSAGENVTVVVKYTGNSLGYVNGNLSYNTENLQYLKGGSSEGDSGLVQLKTWSDDASGKIVFKLKFKAVKSGKAQLSVATNETQNLDGQDMGTPSTSKAISVIGGQQQTTAKQTTEPTTAAPTTETETTEPTTEVTTPSEDSADQNQDKKDALPIGWIIGIGAAIVILIIGITVVIRKRR